MTRIVGFNCLRCGTKWQAADGPTACPECDRLHVKTRDDMIAFEEGIAAEFNAGQIPHPVHLESGNEDGLLRAFREIKPTDWVCGGWRMHLKCLLHGVPPDTLRAAIRGGQSIALNFPEHRIVSSAIVGGILPIAVGLALAIKRAGGSEWVHCFLGDMTERTGIHHECREYAANQRLPLRWIIEDNGLSVCSDTKAVWGEPSCRSEIRYEYSSKWPHAGAGQRVQF